MYFICDENISICSKERMNLVYLCISPAILKAHFEKLFFMSFEASDVIGRGEAKQYAVATIAFDQF
jgi:hypothetical protein